MQREATGQQQQWPQRRPTRRRPNKRPRAGRNRLGPRRPAKRHVPKESEVPLRERIYRLRGEAGRLIQPVPLRIV